MCVVDPACHCILNWSLQMCICNYIERVQAPAPPTQPATINRPAQLPMPLRCRLCSPGCRGGAWGKGGGWPGRLYGLNRVSRSGAAGVCAGVTRWRYPRGAFAKRFRWSRRALFQLQQPSIAVRNAQHGH